MEISGYDDDAITLEMVLGIYQKYAVPSSDIMDSSYSTFTFDYSLSIFRFAKHGNIVLDIYMRAILLQTMEIFQIIW